MRLNTHLSFNGQCQAAFEYYEKHIGGKIRFMMKYGDSPMASQMSPDWRDKIIHGTLALGDNQLTGADAPTEIYQQPQGFSVLLSVDEPADAERIFRVLAEGGTVQMALQETFWALRFGMLVDQFGTPWMISCERPA
jgi:PhnB protein